MNQLPPLTSDRNVASKREILSLAARRMTDALPATDAWDEYINALAAVFAEHPNQNVMTMKRAVDAYERFCWPSSSRPWACWVR